MLCWRHISSSYLITVRIYWIQLLNHYLCFQVATWSRLVETLFVFIFKFTCTWVCTWSSMINLLCGGHCLSSYIAPTCVYWINVSHLVFVPTSNALFKWSYWRLICVLFCCYVLYPNVDLVCKILRGLIYVVRVKWIGQDYSTGSRLHNIVKPNHLDIHIFYKIENKRNQMLFGDMNRTWL